MSRYRYLVSAIHNGSYKELEVSKWHVGSTDGYRPIYHRVLYTELPENHFPYKDPMKHWAVLFMTIREGLYGC